VLTSDNIITCGSVNDASTIIGLKELWAETLGDPRVCIAVLDGPVDQSHPSLKKANLTHLETLVPSGADQGPASQHGTHVASVIFGQHDGPIKGIAPYCRGLIVPIFTDGNDGRVAPCSQLDLARAITQAVQEGAHVINISGGELSPSGTAHPLLADAVQNCAANGVLIVAAAGNEGCECLHVPGALPSVLAVGAMNAQGLPLDSSNWGEQYRLQGVLAPGENVLGANPGGGTVAKSGTSYATPIVSGIAALLLSLQRKLGKEPNPQAVRAAILESAHSCDPQAVLDCRLFMVGSLNVSGALTLTANGHEEDKVGQPAANIQAEWATSDSRPAAHWRQPMLKVGDIAPDFSVKDHNGHNVRLSDYRGKTVVLWFYPQADTPG
jgi:cyanobactin maturation PatA/PatG family protease